MDYVVITPEQFEVSDWSGGSTTQLYIDPAGDDFKKRQFAIRLSSATFTSTGSTFSDFSGYQRMIFPLVGSLSVDHSDQGKPLYARQLKPYEIENFSGSWTTESTNTEDCVDFNLITRDDLVSHTTVLREAADYAPHHAGTLLLYSRSTFSLEAKEKKSEETTQVSVDKGCLLKITESAILYHLHITPGDEPVVIGEVSAVEE